MKASNDMKSGALCLSFDKSSICTNLTGCQIHCGIHSQAENVLEGSKVNIISILLCFDCVFVEIIPSQVQKVQIFNSDLKRSF